MDGVQWAEFLVRAKKRFIYFVGMIFAGFSVFWFLTDDIIAHVKHELLPQEARVIATSPMEYVMVRLQLSLLLSIFIALPIFAFFVLRKLDIEIRGSSVAIWGSLGVILFSMGFAFTYYFLLPITIWFLTELTTEAEVLALYSIHQFVIFTVITSLVFSSVFEMPLVVSWLAVNGYVSIETLTGRRREVYVIIFVIAAIITPDPTFVSQILLAVPLVILYEASIISAKIFGKKD